MISLRVVGLCLAALLTVAAAVSHTATFTASSPSAGLGPIGGTESLIDLVQGQDRLVWTSLAGTVTSYTVIGWPSTHGDVELGGAMVIERPADGSGGVVDLAERPMSVSFELAP